MERTEALFQGLEAPYVLTQVDASTVAVPDDLPDGVTVTSLERAASSHAALVERHLGTIVTDEDPFTARNEARLGRRARSSTSPRGDGARPARSS